MLIAVVAGCNNISQPSVTKSLRTSPNSVYKEQSSTRATAAFGNPDSTALATLPTQSKATVHACQSMVGLVAASQSMPRTTSWLRSGNTRHYTPKATVFPLSVHATKGTWHRLDEVTRLLSANVTFMPSSMVTGSWYFCTNSCATKECIAPLSMRATTPDISLVS